MSSDDRDLLIEVHTAMGFMRQDLKEIKLDLRSERKDLNRVKIKVYSASGLNIAATVVNLVVHALSRLPHIIQA